MQGFTVAQEETGEVLGRDINGGVTNHKKLRPDISEDLGMQEGEQATFIPPFMLPPFHSFQKGRPGSGDMWTRDPLLFGNLLSVSQKP